MLAAQARQFPTEDGSYYSAMSGLGPEHEGSQSVNMQLRVAEQAAAAAAAQPARQKPNTSSRLTDWLTLPGQVVGYTYNGHDVGDQAEIKVNFNYQQMCYQR